MLPKKVVKRVRPPPQPIYEDFTPVQEIVAESSYDIFRLYLPHQLGFTKEDLSIFKDEQSRKILVRGRKQVGQHRFARFESSFNVPNDSNLDKISDTLENNVFALIIPKIIVEEVVPMMAAKEDVKEEQMHEQLTTIEEKKEELMAFNENVSKEIEEKTVVTKEKPMMDEEEMKEEIRKTGVDVAERVIEAQDLNELNEKVQTLNEAKLEERKDEVVPNEIKNEEQVVNDKQKNLEEKNEPIQKEVQEKQLVKEKQNRKRRWLHNEEDKSWFYWLDSEFMKKVCRNKKIITLALVAVSTGFYISRKLSTRGR